MQDPYSILGVSRDASDEDIKKAYRKLSRIYHPDAKINNRCRHLNFTHNFVSFLAIFLRYAGSP